MIRALIVDDEPLARDYLRQILEDQGVHVAGEAENAVQAIQKAEDLKPDLMFLDIQMPGLSGIQLAGTLIHLSAPPLLVFVTGYSEHAVAAFERDALDYLVKPVDPQRLAATLVRARARLFDRKAREQLRRFVNQQATASRPIERLPIRMDYGVRLVTVDEILCAVARDRRVHIRTKQGEWPTYYSLKELEVQLPTDKFLRIHDSCLVNFQSILEVLFLGDHSYKVRLTNGELLPVGRTRYPELQRRMGLSGR